MWKGRDPGGKEANQRTPAATFKEVVGFKPRLLQLQGRVRGGVSGLHSLPTANLLPVESTGMKPTDLNMRVWQSL